MTGFRPTIPTILTGLMLLGLLGAAIFSWKSADVLLYISVVGLFALAGFVRFLWHDLKVTAMAKVAEAPDALKAYRVSFNLAIVLGAVLIAGAAFLRTGDLRDIGYYEGQLLLIGGTISFGGLLVWIASLFADGSHIRLALRYSGIALFVAAAMGLYVLLTAEPPQWLEGRETFLNR